ncbi:MAG: putative addiction module component (TIGR02574 family) [Paraglaciecola sp.]|jgi:putative addiction module component (TIGR02574 family)
MSKLIAEISKLPIPTRIQLVQAILNTISEDSIKEQDYVLTAEQLQEVEKRSASLASGEVRSISWDSIEAKSVHSYKENKPSSTKQITRDDFISFFRNDEQLNTLSNDDRIEVFSQVLPGSSDFTVELLNEVLSDYCVENIEVNETK